MGKRHKGVSYAKYGYIFCIPFALAFLVFSLYPVLYTAVIGFTDLKGIGRTDINFLANPLENFSSLLGNNSFRTSLWNTFTLWIVNFIPQILLALLLTAWFTNRRYKLRGQGAFKILFYMPNIITAASIAILFNYLFGYPMGPINYLFERFGWADPGNPIYFLMQKWTTKGIISFIQFWMWYGYTMLIMISGVLGMNPEIFESSEIDGAKPTQTFLHIVLPNLRTILLYMMITSMIGGLQMFDIPRVFLNGGPDNATLTTSLFIYLQAFSGSYLYNRAAAASMILFLIIAVLSLGLFYIMRDKDAIKQRKAEKERLKAWKASRRESE